MCCLLFTLVCSVPCEGQQSDGVSHRGAYSSEGQWQHGGILTTGLVWVTEYLPTVPDCLRKSLESGLRTCPAWKRFSRKLWCLYLFYLYMHVHHVPVSHVMCVFELPGLPDVHV